MVQSVRDRLDLLRVLTGLQRVSLLYRLWTSVMANTQGEIDRKQLRGVVSLADELSQAMKHSSEQLGVAELALQRSLAQVEHMRPRDLFGALPGLEQRPLLDDKVLSIVADRIDQSGGFSAFCWQSLANWERIVPLQRGVITTTVAEILEQSAPPVAKFDVGHREKTLRVLASASLSAALLIFPRELQSVPDAVAAFMEFGDISRVNQDFPLA